MAETTQMKIYWKKVNFLNRINVYKYNNADGQTNGDKFDTGKAKLCV